MAAAVSGVFIFVGASGQTYMRGAYFPDAAGGPIRFDAGAGASATSPDFATFGETVYIKDIVLGTGGPPTATQFRLTLNGVPTSQLFLDAIHLSTVTFRPTLNLPVPAGSRLGGISVA